MVGWGVEHVPEHRDQHLREQPAKKGGEDERAREHERGLPSTGTPPIERNGSPSAAIVANSWRRSAQADADEQGHRGRREEERECPLDPADPPRGRRS